jgi:hypothetical protein
MPPCMMAARLAMTITTKPKRRLATQKSSDVFW